MQSTQNMPSVQILQNKPTKPNQTYQIKPKLLVTGVNAWVRSAFGNVFSFFGGGGGGVEKTRNNSRGLLPLSDI